MTSPSLRFLLEGRAGGAPLTRTACEFSRISKVVGVFKLEISGNFARRDRERWIGKSRTREYTVIFAITYIVQFKVS